MNTSRYLLLPFIVAFVGLTGCSGGDAPEVVDTTPAPAVTGKNIVFVGSNAEAKKYIGDKTEVVDLEGRVLGTGFDYDHIGRDGV